MHSEVIEFLADAKWKYPSHFRGAKVLEVGSLDVNGSPRQFFDDCQYTGIDLIHGSGVDIALSALEFLRVTGWNKYDTIVCTEMLEHDRDWCASLLAMYVLLRPGGLLLVTAAGVGRPEHGTHRHSPKDSPATLDHYRNIDSSDLRLFADAVGMDVTIRNVRGVQDIRMIGTKRAE